MASFNPAGITWDDNAGPDNGIVWDSPASTSAPRGAVAPPTAPQLLSAHASPLPLALLPAHGGIPESLPAGAPYSARIHPVSAHYGSEAGDAARSAIGAVVGEGMRGAWELTGIPAVSGQLSALIGDLQGKPGAGERHLLNLAANVPGSVLARRTPLGSSYQGSLAGNESGSLPVVAQEAVDALPPAAYKALDAYMKSMPAGRLAALAGHPDLISPDVLATMSGVAAEQAGAVGEGAALKSLFPGARAGAEAPSSLLHAAPDSPIATEQGAVPIFADGVPANKAAVDYVREAHDRKVLLDAIMERNAAKVAPGEMLPFQRKIADVEGNGRYVPQPIPPEPSPVQPNPTADEEAVQALAQAGSVTPANLLNPLAKAGRAVNRWGHNTWADVKAVQKELGVAPETGDVADAYGAHKLMPGRVGTRVEQVSEQAKDMDARLIRDAHSLFVPDAKLRKDLQDYMFFTHAPERNAALADKLPKGVAFGSGVSDAQALAGKQAIESSPHFATVKKYADEMWQYHKDTMKLREDYGLVSSEDVQRMNDAYPNHVPLNRVMEDEPFTPLTPRGLDVRSSGLKGAKGSDRPLADIFENIIAGRVDAIQRGEKNLVDNATLRLVRSTNGLGGLAREIRPAVIGTGSGGRPIFQDLSKDPSVLALRENGQQRFIQFDDPHLAAAFKDANTEELPGLIQAVGTATRLLSGLYTRFSPDFPIANKFRDLPEAMAYMLSQDDGGLKAAGKTLAMAPRDMKAVADGILGRDTPGAKLYAQMREDGGTTGGMALSTRKQLQVNLDKIYKLNRSNPRKAAETFLKTVDNLQAVFEDSTRLSVYRTALENGASRQRAAILAKNASIDFNQHGTGGPLINALFMFSNASIQGSTRMASSLLRNPKALTLVASSMLASQYAVNRWNDSVDPDWRQKLENASPMARKLGLTIVLPGDKFRVVSIPTSWGLMPLKVVFDAALDEMHAGKQIRAWKVVSDIATALVNGYNPLGGEDLISSLTPSLLRTPSDIIRNKRWTGSPIHPDAFGAEPPSTLYYDKLKQSYFGRKEIQLTRSLAANTNNIIDISPADLDYALEQYGAGPGKFVKKATSTIGALAQGQAPNLRDVPVAGRFFIAPSQDQTQGAPSLLPPISRDALAQDASARARDRHWKQEDFLSSIEGKDLTLGQKIAAAKSLFPGDRASQNMAIQAVKAQEKGLTPLERKVMGELGVDDGSRAKFLKAQLDGVPQAQRASLVSRWRKIGLLTPKVERQIGSLP